MDKNKLGLAKTKLQVLYLIGEADTKLTNEQIIRVCAKYEWINYFELQQALAELVERRMLKIETSPNGRNLYSIDSLGKTTLEHFQIEIPYSIRERISTDANLIREVAKKESECVAEYSKLDEDRYIAKLQAFEKEQLLLEVVLNLPTANQARKVCKRWPDVMGKIYELLISSEEE